MSTDPRTVFSALCSCLLLLATVGMLSCKTGFSIEEAGEIALESRRIPMAPPARSIDDLKTQYRDIEQLFPPCDGSYVRELKLRMTEKALSPKYGPAAYHHNSKLMNMSNEAFMLGLHGNSIDLANKVIRAFTGYSSNDRALAYYMLSRYHAFRGDLEPAKDAKRKGDSDNLGMNRSTGFLRSTTEWYISYADFHLNAAAGSIAHMTGKYLEAELRYKEALAKSKEFEKHAVMRPLYMDPDLLLADLADVLARQGRTVEAEIEVRKVLKRLKFAYDVPDQFKIAYFLRQLAEILFRQGRYKDAAWSARTSVFVFDSLCAAKGSVFVAHAKRLLAETLIAGNRFGEALDVFESIRSDLGETEPEVFRRLFQNNVHWALSLLKTGQPNRALSMLEAAAAGSRPSGVRDLVESAVARGFLAMVLKEKGEHAAALAAFEKSIPALVSDPDPGRGSHRDTQFRQILEAYMELVVDIQAEDACRGKDVTAVTFEMSQWLRNSSAKRALSASSARNSVKDGELAELIRKEQDITHRLDALKRHVLNRLSDPEAFDADNAMPSIEARLTRLRAARETLLGEIQRRFPEYAQAMDPKTVSIQEAQNVLKTDEAFVAVYPTARRTFVWAIPPGGEARLAVVGETGRRDLRRIVLRLRRALSPSPVPFSLGDIPPFDCRLSHALYEKILRPLQEAWKDRKHLIVVATGPLGSLPFAVLSTSSAELPEEGNDLFDQYRFVPWLIRKVAVTREPSAASFVSSRLSPLRSVPSEPFIGFGDPVFHPSQLKQADDPATRKYGPTMASGKVPISIRGIRTTTSGPIDDRDISSIELSDLNRLPDTAEEIGFMARTLGAPPQNAVFLGKRASEDTVKAMELSDRRVITFASHALNPHDLDGLDQPAIALSSPLVTGGKEDGLLTMGEVLGLDLNADWVVLSACNTGAGEGRGAEAVSGLGRAFFYAGARSLLVSMWAVETVSAKRLTTTLFRLQYEQRRLARAESLRQSMLSLMHAPGVGGYTYAHPFFWAPFVVVGDGR